MLNILLVNIQWTRYRVAINLHGLSFLCADSHTTVPASTSRPTFVVISCRLSLFTATRYRPKNFFVIFLAFAKKN